MWILQTNENKLRYLYIFKDKYKINWSFVNTERSTC